MAENLDVTGWDLEEKEVEAISALDRGLRFNDPLNVSDSDYQYLLNGC